MVVASSFGIDSGQPIGNGLPALQVGSSNPCPLERLGRHPRQTGRHHGRLDRLGQEFVAEFVQLVEGLFVKGDPSDAKTLFEPIPVFNGSNLFEFRG